MTAKKKEATKHLGLRIPIPLHAMLTELAKSDDRSLSNYIINLLRKAADKKR